MTEVKRVKQPSLGACSGFVTSSVLTTSSFRDVYGVRELSPINSRTSASIAIKPKNSLWRILVHKSFLNYSLEINGCLLEKSLVFVKDLIPMGLFLSLAF